MAKIGPAKFSIGVNADKVMLQVRFSDEDDVVGAVMDRVATLKLINALISAYLTTLGDPQ